MFGFTKNERIVLLALLAGFCVGSTGWYYREHVARLPETTHVVRYSVRDAHAANLKGSEAGIAKINLNSASEKELSGLPGIGPVMAKRIVTFRETAGPFDKPASIKDVHGIGQKTFEKIQPFITTAVKEDS